MAALDSNGDANTKLAAWACTRAISRKAPNMTDLDAAPSAGRFEVRVTADSHFSWIRTRLSVERTMMSWLRTATALIGFGFAIVQFFERLQLTPEARSAYLPNAPIYLGLALIPAGSSRLSSRFGNIGGRSTTYGENLSRRSQARARNR
jgi:Domain of unknown function (DUF202)